MLIGDFAEPGVEPIASLDIQETIARWYEVFQVEWLVLIPGAEGGA